MARYSLRASHFVDASRPQMVYLAGWGRSGSTLIANLLGEYPAAVSVGELRYLFHSGVSCGCGKLAASCEFWRAVTTRAEAKVGIIDRREFVALQRRLLAPKRTPSLLWHHDEGTRYLACVTAALHSAIAEETGASVVIDSSKHPADAALITASPTAKLLHLVRDPRATAYSWSHRRRSGQQALGVTQATVRWAEWNFLVDLVAMRVRRTNRRRLRYEDFVQNPVAILRELAAWAGIEDDGERPADGGSLRLGDNHVVNGNPSKFLRDDVVIAPDEEWRQALPVRQARAIVAVTWPMMMRFGYLRNSRKAQRS